MLLQLLYHANTNAVKFYINKKKWKTMSFGVYSIIFSIMKMGVNSTNS